MMMLFRNADDRLRAISDGVFAVVLTIMVLNIKVPTSALSTAAMYRLGQAIATYLISFAVVIQYWHFH
ncbi:TMEM175 family protein [Lactiplantibacillus fabifermentans]|nr:TMEM175 family protein [Lactiplantibacillus fabifermentans]